ncbi:MAG: energy transducer TonB [Candidatus Delongbacteria bacterium]|jgi:protein TonB|nr:energy transducer TonB [Candidatus Delongbacteria bacterium]
MAHKVGKLHNKTLRLEEISTIVVFVLLTFVFAIFHKFETQVIEEGIRDIDIVVEKVEITEQVKKTIKPASVKIPIAVEDEDEIDEDNEIEIETTDFAFNDPPPPPPPPPSVDEEQIFDFFAIQEKPEMMPGESKKISRYIYKNYPPLAKRSGVSGKVRLKWVVNKDGLPTDVIIVKEKPKDMGFGKVAQKAIQQARYKPGMQRDTPVAVRMAQWIKFNTR